MQQEYRPVAGQTAFPEGQNKRAGKPRPFENHDFGADYSAATAASAFSTRTAEYLNSGILP